MSLPDDALTNVSQLAFDDAAHVQLPDVFVMVTLKLPPDEEGDCDVDDSVYEHATGVVGVVGVELSLLQAETVTAAAQSARQMSFMM